MLTAYERRLLDHLLDPPVCGTPEGYRAHRQQHRLPCSDCSAAWDVSPGCKPVVRESCGSHQGWLDHRRRMEWPCPGCASARERHESKLCGSLSGWNIHRRNGTAICGRCERAERQYRAQVSADRARGIPRRRPRSLEIPRGSTSTRQLLRARARGALLVHDLQRDGLPSSVVPVAYTPRNLYDSRPWLVQGTGLRVLAQDCRAVHTEGN